MQFQTILKQILIAFGLLIQIRFPTEYFHKFIKTNKKQKTEKIYLKSGFMKRLKTKTLISVIFLAFVTALAF